jgi:protein required for attachment to host cells
MIRPRKILYVITDGGQARFVDYAMETESFTTIGTLDAGHPLHSRLLGDDVASHGGGDHHIRGSDAHVREAREGFAHEAAKAALLLARKGEFTEVFIAAPARLVGALRSDLEKSLQIAGTASKDLTKVSDHDLGKWLKQSLYT